MKNQTMGMMISSLRKQNGMTQLELADIFQISVDELMQIKTAESNTASSARENIEHILHLVFKALALAMGVGTVVLSMLKQIDMYSGFTMLGIGLACVAVTLLGKLVE